MRIYSSFHFNPPHVGSYGTKPEEGIIDLMAWVSSGIPTTLLVRSAFNLFHELAFKLL
jgi:hypothetical protein